MLKILHADKDTYITDRLINTERVLSSNLGSAGSLDLFKLYGATLSGSTPNIELSRLLVHFDMSWLTASVLSGKIDPGHPSFNCTLKLFDVYGGQPTPSDFTVTVAPLSRSFDEGLGRDVVFYADRDVCNFMSSSRSGGAWILSGCSSYGAATGSVDYITNTTIGGSVINLGSQQTFNVGTEDLSVNVTTIVSATLAHAIPDAGFRLAFSDSIERDTRTYFVKRFGARGAFNELKRPALWVSYDNSIIDDALKLRFDEENIIWLFNFAQGSRSNILSASTQITGANSLMLKLVTPISGGFYSASFSGSQHKMGINSTTGYYSASANISSQQASIAAKLALSGSVDFTPIWYSLNGTLGYFTGSKVTFYASDRGMSLPEPKKYIVASNNVQTDLQGDELITVRVELFDNNSPYIKTFRTPVVTPGAVVRDVHWSIRDTVLNKTLIPFDQTYNSTRLSSDASGMFFELDASNLTTGNEYTIDVLIDTGGSRQVYKSTCAPFRVRPAS